MDCFKNCPYKYKLRYIERLKVLQDYEPNNPLLIGTLLHNAVEVGIEKAKYKYFKNYPIINDYHIDEVIKVEVMSNKVRKLLTDKKIAFEYKLNTSDFIGYIDCVEVLKDGTFALYDFKYSNNVSNYDKSAQIHLYKYFFEQQTGEKVSKLAYIMVPKLSTQRKFNDDVQAFRRDLKRELARKEAFIHRVTYSSNKVITWLLDLKRCMEATEYPKNETRLCYYCDYYDYCQKGIDFNVITKK